MSLWLAIAAVAWGALAFGAVYEWAWWPLLAFCAAAGALGLIRSRGQRDRLPVVLLGAFGVVGLAVALQLVPLPASVLRAISPATDAFLLQHNVPYAALAPSGAARHALSLFPTDTVHTLALFVGLSLLLAGLAVSLRAPTVRRLAASVIALAVLMALIAIVQKATVTTGKVYGFWTPEERGDLFGPFVNKNHFAGWMVMALPLAVGLVCAGIARGMRGVKPEWRERILWLSSPAASAIVLTAFATLIMGLSLVMSLSRSGITAFAASLLLAGWAVTRRQAGASRRRAATAYIALVFIVAVGWAGVDTVARRFAAASWNDMGRRLGAWEDTIRIARDFPLTGVGLNAYGEAMLGYQTTDLEQHFAQAHDDYLQLAAEGGLLVGIPVIIAVFLFVREIRRRFREDADDTTTYWLRIGAVTGLVAIALQECVEFSLQMPGNAVLFTVLAAIAIHKPAGGRAEARHYTLRGMNGETR